MPKVIPPVVGHDDEFFWEGVKRGTLLFQSCADCGLVRHPPSPMCSSCHSVRASTTPSEGKGTVHSWIVSRHPSQPDDEARIVALVELNEGIRIVSNLQDVYATDVYNEMPVELCFREVDGVMLPQFRPVAAPGASS